MSTDGMSCANEGFPTTEHNDMENTTGTMSNDDVVSELNDLIETCKDGEYGFRTCAEHAESAQIKSTFSSRAAECQRGASELQSLVTQLGGKADTGGSATGGMHRGWVAVLGTLSGGSDQKMLNEAERGEDVALARYRDAIKKPLPANVMSVVRNQYDGVKRNHDQIRNLRDANKAR